MTSCFPAQNFIDIGQRKAIRLQQPNCWKLPDAKQLTYVWLIHTEIEIELSSTSKCWSWVKCFNTNRTIAVCENFVLSVPTEKENIYKYSGPLTSWGTLDFVHPRQQAVIDATDHKTNGPFCRLGSKTPNVWSVRFEKRQHGNDQSPVTSTNVEINLFFYVILLRVFSRFLVAALGRSVMNVDV